MYLTKIQCNILCDSKIISWAASLRTVHLEIVLQSQSGGKIFPSSFERLAPCSFFVTKWEIKPVSLVCIRHEGGEMLFYVLCVSYWLPLCLWCQTSSLHRAENNPNCLHGRFSIRDMLPICSDLVKLRLTAFQGSWRSEGGGGVFGQQNASACAQVKTSPCRMVCMTQHIWNPSHLCWFVLLINMRVHTHNWKMDFKIKT